jgi:hypothetical protein
MKPAGRRCVNCSIARTARAQRLKVVAEKE